jgi:hypothetical protein
MDIISTLIDSSFLAGIIGFMFGWSVMRFEPHIEKALPSDLKWPIRAITGVLLYCGLKIGIIIINI